jgi:hypothetical protein
MKNFATPLHKNMSSSIPLLTAAENRNSDAPQRTFVYNPFIPYPAAIGKQNSNDTATGKQNSNSTRQVLFSFDEARSFKYVLTVFGLSAHLLKTSRKYRLLYAPLSYMISNWILLAWLVRLICFASGDNFPTFIPGWAEVSVSNGLGNIVGAAILCSLSSFCVYRSRKIVMSEILDLLLPCVFKNPELASNYLKLMRRQVVLILVFSSGAAILGIISVVSSPIMRQIYGSYNPINVAFQIIFTLLEYFACFGIMSTCTVLIVFPAKSLVMEIQHFSNRIEKERIHAKEIIDWHIDFRKKVEKCGEHARSFLGFGGAIPTLCLLFNLIFLLEIGKAECGYLFRFYFIAIFFIPVSYAFISSGQLSAAQDELYRTFTTRLSNEEQSDQLLLSYAIAWKLNGEMSYTFFGISVDYSTLYRFLYGLLTFCAYVFQKVEITKC